MNYVALKSEGQTIGSTHEYEYPVGRDNRFLRQRKMEVELKKPWQFVFDYNEKMALKRAGSKNKNPLGEEIFAQNAIWLSLLNEIRTFFKENSGVEF